MTGLSGENHQKAEIRGHPNKISQSTASFSWIHFLWPDGNKTQAHANKASVHLSMSHSTLILLVKNILPLGKVWHQTRGEMYTFSWLRTAASYFKNRFIY